MATGRLRPGAPNLAGAARNETPISTPAQSMIRAPSAQCAIARRWSQLAISVLHRLHLLEAQPPGRQALKHPLAAGQEDDLQLGRGADQDLEHLLDAPIVGEHQRVVEHHDRRPPLVGEQLGERETGQHRDLLARAVAQPLERLGAARRGRRR